MLLEGWIIEAVGGVAAMLTTGCFVPQAVKVMREKDTQAISFWMYLLFCCGVFCWLVYGVMIMSWPVIIANAVTFCLALSILVMKVRYG